MNVLPSIEVLQRVLWEREDPEFQAWVVTVPDKHWAKLDLSALRIGFELGKASARSGDVDRVTEERAAELARKLDEAAWTHGVSFASVLNDFLNSSGYFGPALWALHIIGPDDVHPAPSKYHARAAADRFNDHHGGVLAGIPVQAVVARWPHSDESHARDVGRFCEEWLMPAP